MSFKQYLTEETPPAVAAPISTSASLPMGPPMGASMMPPIGNSMNLPSANMPTSQFVKPMQVKALNVWDILEKLYLQKK